MIQAATGGRTDKVFYVRRAHLKNLINLYMQNNNEMRIGLFYDKTVMLQVLRVTCYVFRVTLVTVSRMPITHTLKNESRHEAFFLN